jgi:hypothetical protein
VFRIIGFIVGAAVAAAGGVITYRAFFIEPSAAVIVTDSDVRELPDTARVLGGIIMLVAGIALAFYAARRRPV